jgi:hypothetical protein
MKRGKKKKLYRELVMKKEADEKKRKEILFRKF